MLTTPNYGLKKPEGTDVVNIDDFNGNADIIDTKLKDLNTTKAPLDSPGFTGTPTTPTPTAGDNSNKMANTAFVTTAVANKTSVTGNAGTATKLQTARNITLAGDMSGSGSFDGSSDITITATAQLQEQKTYAQLATMVTNNQLVPGTQYVLTDYATKYQQPDTLNIKTMSIERLVLTATSTNTFDVVCSSLDYPQDIIYYQFGANLCEDKTTARNGFIMRRIDESPNSLIDCPLDWRKILWARYKPNTTNYLIGTTSTAYSTWTSGPAILNVIYKSGNVLYMAKNTNTPTSATDSAVFSPIYDDITIGMMPNSNLRVGNTGTQDIFLMKGVLHERPTFGVNCNRISFDQTCYFTNYYNDSKAYMVNNVFGDRCEFNSFGSNSSNNTFGNDCKGISFDSSCCGNTLSNNCYNFSFGSSSSGNTFGYNCGNIAFASSCNGNTLVIGANNTFGASCNNNSFMCSSNNTFGSGCYNNVFGGTCGGNTFASDCYYNTFVHGCDSNYFATLCVQNKFGTSCFRNSLGVACTNNIFGDNCINNNFMPNCYNNTFGSGCSSNMLGVCCMGNAFGTNCNYNNIGDTCNWNTFGNNKCTLHVVYMRSKNISSVTALEYRDYTTTIIKRNDNATVFYDVPNTNTPIYTVIA